MSGKSHAENMSRDKFEAAMLSRYQSMETLFKAFERYPKKDRLMPGKYVRGEVQSMWEGWELHRHSQSGAAVKSAGSTNDGEVDGK